MRLSSFISSNLDAILIDWVAFARSQLPAAATMDEAALLDHDQFARDTLDEIAAISGGRVLDLEVEGNLEGEWDARRLHQALSNLVFNALK